MAINIDNLRIVYYPDPVLRKKAAPIAVITQEVRNVVEKMLQLMREAPGVGLAAPQVGLPWRLFVANATGEPSDDQVYINPELTLPSTMTEVMEEGCLSLPEINGQIRRPKGITIKATSLDGQDFELFSSELEARIWQHEYDHLEGIMIIDKMTPLDRMASAKTLKALKNTFKK